MNERIVKTGIPNSDLKAKEIINSIFGQLSDGKWENSPRMEQYWQNCDADSQNGEIVLNIGSNCDLYNKSDSQIKAWFADKAKSVCKELNGWDRTSTNSADGFGYKEDIKVSDVYRVYDILKERGTKSYGETAANEKEIREDNKKANERKKAIKLMTEYINEAISKVKSEIDFKAYNTYLIRSAEQAAEFLFPTCTRNRS